MEATYHFLRNNKYLILSFIWMILVSVLTIIKYSPKYLNADTILNTVMSLQNITLYYWGQNRLLNVLPLVVVFFKNPIVNLYGILMFTSASFFCLLFYMSRLSARFLEVDNLEKNAFKIFTILSVLFILSFDSFAIYEITMGQIAYSFSALLLISSASVFFGFNKIKYKVLFLPLSIASVVVAIGLNPSAIILVLAISAAYSFYKKSIQINELVFCIFSGIVFYIWSIVSKNYIEKSFDAYSIFSISILQQGFEKVLLGLLCTTNLFFLIGIFTIFSAHYLISFYNSKSNEKKSKIILLFTRNVVLIFAITWLIIFSSNKWVEMNKFAWRYFTYVIFSLIFLGSLYCASFISNLKNKSSQILTVAAIIVCLSYLISPIQNLKDYKIFNRVNTLTESGGQLYAGDYWLVWPSVLRDMILGYEAFGLCYRGDGNKSKTTSYVLNKIRQQGYADVYCLNDSVENCVSQVNSLVGPLQVIDLKKLKKDVYKIRFGEHWKIYTQYLLDSKDRTRSETFQPYPKEKFNKLTPKILGKKIYNRQPYVAIQIENHSNTSFACISKSNNPIRVSWRFIDFNGKPITEWDDTRTDLLCDIPAKGSMVIILPLIQNNDATPVADFQVSLVQEGVFWLHDLGIAPASKNWASLEEIGEINFNSIGNNQ